MEPLILYILAAVLFVLGLAVVGGALFGRKRKQRLVLVAASAILWGSALLLYGCTSTVYAHRDDPNAGSCSRRLRFARDCHGDARVSRRPRLRSCRQRLLPRLSHRLLRS